MRKNEKLWRKIYGYPYDGIDVNLCTNVEAFKELK